MMASEEQASNHRSAADRGLALLATPAADRDH